MGLLDFFKKGTTTKPATTVNAEELKNQIFECIYANTLVEFENLCHENEQEIIRLFPGWRRPPEEVQADKDAMRKYSYCLMVLASYFQRQLNNGELMTMLTGIDDSENSRKWQEKLGYCRALMQQELKFDEAIPLLEECLEMSGNLSGACVDKFLPLTQGFLGECYFHKNQPAKASGHVEEALQYSNMQGDWEATVAYSSNLFEIHRYMGDNLKAAEYAEAIADKAFDRGELITASNWRHHARAARAGEPLYRISLKIGEELFELDEIPKVHEERVEFMFVRNRMELVLCSQKCHEARDHAQKGEYDKALEILEEAAGCDNYSPLPYYLSGEIKLAGRRYADSIKDFEKVEELCPGFETSRSDLWLARQLNNNSMQHDACMAVFEAGNDAVPVEQRIKLCQDLIAKYPKFAEAYWRTGKMFVESQKPEEALDHFQRGLAVVEDEDLRSRFLRDVAVLTKDETEKRKLLESAITVPNGNLLAKAMCIYMLKQREPEPEEE